MIITDPNEMSWGAQYEEPHAPDLTLFMPTHHRVSELLGPDGEPLMVPYARHKLGFDLTPRKRKGQ